MSTFYRKSLALCSLMSNYNLTFQNLLGYNEKSDIYSLGVAACEMANGLIPFSEMPGTLMFLEKLRGASPKLLDKLTFEEGDEEALRTISPQLSPEQEQQPSSFGGEYIG